MPDNIPAAGVIVATAVSPLIQVPPAPAFESVVLFPTQTVNCPEIGGMELFTVTVVVAIQPLTL